MSTPEDELKSIFQNKLEEMLNRTEIVKMLADPGYLPMKVNELHQFVNSEFKEASNENKELYRKMIDDQMNLCRQVMVPPTKEEGKEDKKTEELSSAQPAKSPDEPELPQAGPASPKVEMLSITQKLIKLLTEAYERYLAEMEKRNVSSPAQESWGEVKAKKDEKLAAAAVAAENEAKSEQSEEHSAEVDLENEATVDIDTVEMGLDYADTVKLEEHELPKAQAAREPEVEPPKPK